MNIFVLDLDIQRCARYHCDQHVVKMILESVQILCTAMNKSGSRTPYKSTHINHPCVHWVERSTTNFEWLKTLALCLNDEFRYRFGRQDDHKSIAVLNALPAPVGTVAGLTEFAQAMPIQYKVQGDAVQAYRNFYRYEKSTFARWTRRRRPRWMI